MTLAAGRALSIHQRLQGQVTVVKRLEHPSAIEYQQARMLERIFMASGGEG